MAISDGMITKNVSLDDLVSMISDCIDDGIYSPVAICRENGIDYQCHAIRNRMKKVYGFCMMDLIKAERVNRLVALAIGGRLMQKEAAIIVGWSAPNAAVQIREMTGKTYEQIRKEAMSCQTKI